jgi:hypothetical protein
MITFDYILVQQWLWNTTIVKLNPTEQLLRWSKRVLLLTDMKMNCRIFLNRTSHPPRFFIHFQVVVYVEISKWWTFTVNMHWNVFVFFHNTYIEPTSTKYLNFSRSFSSYRFSWKILQHTDCESKDRKSRYRIERSKTIFAKKVQEIKKP